MKKIRVAIPGLDAASALRFEQLALGIEGVRKVDSWPGQAELLVAPDADEAHIRATLALGGFPPTVGPKNSRTYAVDGMTCRSCEITIERALKKLPGVTGVRADAAGGRVTIEGVEALPAAATLQQALHGRDYVVRNAGAPGRAHAPRALELFGLFAAAILLAKLLGRLDFVSLGAVGGAIGFAAAFMIGLVAGSSSCVAVSGGLMLSMIGKYRAKVGSSVHGRFIPIASFIGGRVVAYAVLGGAIALIGRTLMPSPLATGVITIVAAVVMLIMGLDMLHLAPAWLLALIPRSPKRLAHRVVDAEESGRISLPALLGAATFFVPCGFTQALQIYALTSGSFMAGAAVLGGFALGTAPALAALGAASTSLKGRWGDWLMKFSGAFVVVLGLWNVQNGLTAAGLRLPTIGRPDATIGVEYLAPVENGVQIAELTLTGTAPYYSPRNGITVRQGMPVRLTIHGIGMGCRSQFQIPALGVTVPLAQAENVIEFTPDKIGPVTFSCAMGMYPGTIHVVPRT